MPLDNDERAHAFGIRPGRDDKLRMRTVSADQLERLWRRAEDDLVAERRLRERAEEDAAALRDQVRQAQEQLQGADARANGTSQRAAELERAIANLQQQLEAANRLAAERAELLSRMQPDENLRKIAEASMGELRGAMTKLIAASATMSRAAAGPAPAPPPAKLPVFKLEFKRDPNTGLMMSPITATPV